MTIEEARATGKTKPRIVDPFDGYLEGMRTTHAKKGHDYASDENPYQNFDRQEVLMAWFDNDSDKVFAGIIGQKLGRLGQLLNGKEPKNESIDDTFEDIANYVLCWRAKRELAGRRQGQQTDRNRGEVQEVRDRHGNLPNQAKLVEQAVESSPSPLGHR